MAEIGSSERDLARALITYLVKKGWPQPYQEVKYRKGTADIVVDRSGHGWVIECKKSLSLAVLGQAYEWQHDNRFVSVAVFKAKARDSGRDFARTLCRHFGLGLFEIDKYGYAAEIIHPQDRRRRTTAIGDILQSCRKEHLTWCEAGSQNGAFTAFKNTLVNVRTFLANNGPSTVKTIVENIEHHYRNASSARSSLLKWLPEPKVCPGIGIERGKELRFYLLEGFNVFGKHSANHAS